MPLNDDFEVERKLAMMGDLLAEEVDKFINDEDITNRKHGFILFIIDHGTGVTRMTTSCNKDDVTELLRFWVKSEDDKRLS